MYSLTHFKHTLLFIIALLPSVFSYAQCGITVPSSNGYEVHIKLVPTKIIAPSNCPNGYNFNVEIDYDITFTGNNPPSSLYTLQGNLACGQFQNIFFNLPNGGGKGTVTTSGNPYNSNTDCTTATVQSLNCTEINLFIQGPGISTENIYCSAVLPVELAYFKAIPEVNFVKLLWKTESELNNDFFTLERSRDARTWETIKIMDGAGNSNSPLTYKEVDEAPLPGTSYYRLKQTDFDDQYSYSPVQAVTRPETDEVPIRVFPNPVSNELNLFTDGRALTEVQVFDLHGHDVTPQASTIAKSANAITLNFSALPSGLYFVKTQHTLQKIYKL